MADGAQSTLQRQLPAEGEIIQIVKEACIAALPELDADSLAELLEFVAVQHTQQGLSAWFQLTQSHCAICICYKRPSLATNPAEEVILDINFAEL